MSDWRSWCGKRPLTGGHKGCWPAESLDVQNVPKLKGYQEIISARRRCRDEDNTDDTRRSLVEAAGLPFAVPKTPTGEQGITDV